MAENEDQNTTRQSSISKFTGVSSTTTPTTQSTGKLGGYKAVTTGGRAAEKTYRETQRKSSISKIGFKSEEEKKKEEAKGLFSGGFGLGDVLDVLDVGKRVVISTVKETADLLPGGDKASFGDWVDQVEDKNFGFGTIAPKTGNKWLDRIIGFTGDVLLDPLTYVTFGAGGVAKTAAMKGTQLAAKGGRAGAKGARILAAEADFATKRTAKLLADDAVEKAIKSGDEIAIGATRAAAKEADDALAASTKFLNKTAGKTATVRGRAGRESLAENVRLIRQDALREAADETLDDATRLAAQRVAATLDDDVIGNIATRGMNAIQGDVAEVLGVQGGLKFGVGRFSTYIPGSAKLTNALGTKLVNTRLNLFTRPNGLKILDKITPMGKAGLFGQDDILKMRTALRTGTVKGSDAVDYVGMLAADQNYRRVLNLQNSRVGQKVASAIRDEDAKLLNSVVDFLEIPEAQWAARGIAPTAEQTRVLAKIKSLTDNLYDEANSAAKALGGEDLPYNARFFPHSQTDQAITWIERNSAQADKIAEDLGIDRTYLQGNFVERRLVPGRKWFGKELTQADIDGGVRRLNQIAKESGQIKFNFFTEDVKEALGKYAYKHGRYMAYTDSIKKLADPVVGALDTVRPLATQVAKGTKRPAQEAYDLLRSTLSTALTPTKLQQWSPEQAVRVRDALEGVARRLGGDELVSREIADAIVDIDEMVAEVNRAIVRGQVPPAMQGLLNNEIEAYAMAVRNQLDNIGAQIKVTDPNKWKTVSSVAEDGFAILNPYTIPDIQVRNEVLEMFNNVKRLDNPKFAESAEKLLGDFNTFFKSWVTATPGFHVRNALSNTISFIVAGGNPLNGMEAAKIYGDYVFQKGKKIINSPEEYVKSLKLPAAREKALIDAFSSINAGQYGEVAEAAGVGTGIPGVFGRQATGEIPIAGRFFNTPEALRKPGRAISKIGGAVPYGSRKVGQGIENIQRFTLTYDGLMKGLTVNEAAARTNKYLFDYADLSKADRVIKQVVPFWMFMSRNLPLQIENMFLNPKVYQYYKNLKKLVADEDQPAYLPGYLSDSGAFILEEDIPLVGGMIAKPDIGLLGTGQGFPGLTSGASDVRGRLLDVLAVANPLIRTPIEYTTGVEAFTGEEIAKPWSELTEEEQRRYYAYRNLLPPISTFGRYGKPIPGFTESLSPEMQQLFSAYAPTGSDAERKLEERRNRALLSLLGVPVQEFTESMEVGEIKRRNDELAKELARRERNKNK